MAKLDNYFSLIIRDFKSPNNLQTIADRIIEHFQQPFNFRGIDILVTCRIGAAVYPDDAKKTETLVKNAQLAISHVKEKRRSACAFYNESMNQSASKFLTMENDIRTSLKNDDFFVVYQPKYDLHSDTITNVEALVRWNHPMKGLVSPMEFIPVAEESGLITELGQVVLEKACKACVEWHKRGLTDLCVSVNLSPKQFSGQELFHTLEATLQRTGLDGRFLEVELTEGMIMLFDEPTIKIMKKLKQLGVKISIDDFGTGYSSLQYLSQFPLDIIKIDQSFIRNILEDKRNAAITNTIIHLAHNLQLTVIAEGVETKAQLEFLRKHRCDAIQGYYISKPLPDHELEAFLRRDATGPYQAAS